MSDELQIHVGDTMEAVGARVIAAWHRMEQGEDVHEKHVSFETWEAMVKVLSPERLALLRHVHRDPAPSVRSLSQTLGRDVREDVHALAEAGLLDQDETGLSADYVAFDVSMWIAL